MSFDSYFAKYEAKLIDFWERRQNALTHSRSFSVFGRQVQLLTNEEEVLKAVDYSLPLYSSAPIINDRQFKIQIVVRPFPIPPGPLPDNLFNHIHYSGHDHILAMQFGSWGHCQVDLIKGEAHAVLSAELGCRPEYISRFMLNTILTNFMKSLGLGFVHATAVYRNNHLLMMMAGHNSGKSTTALHLTLNGFAFVSDSQIYIEQREDGLQLYAFPVGRVKLRRDMLPQFPRLEAFLAAEPVRQETKFRLDLHRVDPALVYDDVIRPDKIILCLLSRSDREKTTISSASEIEALETAMMNSLYYDTADVWQKNFAQIERLVRQGHCCRVTIGTEVNDIIRAVNDLMG